MANAYSNRGMALCELGDYLGALDDYNKSLQINPISAATYNNRGIARSKIGDKQGAMEDLRKAIEFFIREGDSQWYKLAFRAFTSVESSKLLGVA
jgi:tetratricopeptide (TPR) repeat protein